MTGPVLLSGGNPQIPKGEGPAPVQAWLGALPGWKREAGAILHQIVLDEVPGVAMAVKWNSPFYGTQPGHWFLCLHAFDRYIKASFFRGSELQPPPPAASKYPAVRSLRIHENDAFSDDLRHWVRQAKDLEGERL